MIKVLIITYYWPPAGGPGVQRWLKFSKYLPANGIQPFVLTVDPEFATYPIIDGSLEKEVSDAVKVFKTETREFYGTYKKATSRKGVPYSGFASEKKKPGLKEKVARFVRGNFFYPDPRKGWKKFAIARAQEVIESENISVVISTGPPHSTHLIGLYLKKSLAIKWVADFRDPWTDIYYYRDFYPTALVRLREAKMEANVLKHADKITTASPGFGRLLAKKMEQPEKVLPITNGFDQDDLPEPTTSRASEKIEITYTGTITGKYPLATLVDALKMLEGHVQQNVCFNLVGKADSATEQLLSGPDIKFEVKLWGYVSHSEVMGILSKSDFLLLIIPSLKGNEGIIPAKLFEYIGSGKQIIGIGPEDCDAAQIVDENGFGGFFAPTDASGLKDWLSEELKEIKTNKMTPVEKRKKYSRHYLTARLSDMLKSL